MSNGGTGGLKGKSEKVEELCVDDDLQLAARKRSVATTKNLFYGYP
jgi:hypothetical protein